MNVIQIEELLKTIRDRCEDPPKLSVVSMLLQVGSEVHLIELKCEGHMSSPNVNTLQLNDILAIESLSQLEHCIFMLHLENDTWVPEHFVKAINLKDHVLLLYNSSGID